MALERLYLPGMEIDDAPKIVGLFQKPDGSSWVRDVDGTETRLPAGAGGGAPVDAQYVTMALNGTLTGERVLTAGDALDLTDGGANGPATLDVLVDGVSIGVNGFNELEVIGGALTDAVIKAPGSDVRNLITPTGDFVNLPLAGVAGQTKNMLQATLFGGSTPAFRVGPAGSVGIGTGTYTPSSYAGYLVKLVIAAGGLVASPAGGTPLDPGAGGVAYGLVNDVRISPSAGIFHSGAQLTYAVFDGVNTGSSFYGQSITHLFNGTKAAASGAQQGSLTGLNIVSEQSLTATGDVTTHRGIDVATNDFSSGSKSRVIGIHIDTFTRNAGVTIPEFYGMEVNCRASSLGTPLVTKAAGINIPAVGRRSTVATSYGIFLANQAVQSPSTPGDPYAIYSAGGKSFLHAGLSTVVPLTLKGAAAQSADLQQWQSSVPTTLLSVTGTGSLDFLEQTTPGSPVADTARLFTRDNGAGKTQLCVKFESGNIIVIATDF